MGSSPRRQTYHAGGVWTGKSEMVDRGNEREREREMPVHYLMCVCVCAGFWQDLSSSERDLALSEHRARGRFDLIHRQMPFWSDSRRVSNPLVFQSHLSRCTDSNEMMKTGLCAVQDGRRMPIYSCINTHNCPVSQTRRSFFLFSRCLRTLSFRVNAHRLMGHFHSV